MGMKTFDKGWWSKILTEQVLDEIKINKPKDFLSIEEIDKLIPEEPTRHHAMKLDVLFNKYNLDFDGQIDIDQYNKLSTQEKKSLHKELVELDEKYTLEEIKVNKPKKVEKWEIAKNKLAKLRDEGNKDTKEWWLAQIMYYEGMIEKNGDTNGYYSSQINYNKEQIHNLEAINNPNWVVENEEPNNLYDEFVQFVEQKLKLSDLKQYINLTQDKSDTETFAHFNPETNEIVVYVKDRINGDWMRSLAHECVHYKQNQDGVLTPESGKTGHKHENEANSTAGVIMREFGKKHPEIFTTKHEEQLDEIKINIPAHKPLTFIIEDPGIHWGYLTSKKFNGRVDASINKISKVIIIYRINHIIDEVADYLKQFGTIDEDNTLIIPFDKVNMPDELYEIKINKPMGHIQIDKRDKVDSPYYNPKAHVVKMNNKDNFTLHKHKNYYSLYPSYKTESPKFEKIKEYLKSKGIHFKEVSKTPGLSNVQINHKFFTSSLEEIKINKPGLESQLYPEWVKITNEYGDNEFPNSWEDLIEYQKNNFLEFVKLCKKYPKANKTDIQNIIWTDGNSFDEFEWEDEKSARVIYDKEEQELQHRLKMGRPNNINETFSKDWWGKTLFNEIKINKPANLNFKDPKIVKGTLKKDWKHLREGNNICLLDIGQYYTFIPTHPKNTLKLFDKKVIEIITDPKKLIKLRCPEKDDNWVDMLKLIEKNGIEYIK